MLSFSDLKKNLQKNGSHLKSVRIAILGDSSTQYLAHALKGYAFDQGFNVELFDAPYNQIEQQIINNSSDLYAFKPTYILIAHSHIKLFNRFSKLSKAEKEKFADNHIAELNYLIGALQRNLSCNIIYFNFPEALDPVFGNFGNKLSFSFIYQLRKLNYELMRLSELHIGVFINDVAALTNRLGYFNCFTPALYISADLIYNFDFLPLLAKNIIDVIKTLNGKIIKCVVLDLDNTLWGGIIGDDGIEKIQLGDLGIGKAFTNFQLWMKQLKERGIILAVCSKNNEDTAKKPFVSHPDMVLILEDISVFVANWDNKAQNIAYIKEFLNIGYDSMVFIDDSQFERNLVRNSIPDIIVPELPEDPADYIYYLQSLNLFEITSYSGEDENRTQLYKEDHSRKEFQKAFIDENEYLNNLGLKVEIVEFNSYNIPRITQLIQRSNQFNLRTVRYTEEDIAKMADSSDYLCYAFSLEDKYGKYGLISIVILKAEDFTLFTDTWVMSCRALNRGVEQFVLNYIVENAKEKNITVIRGEYIPTTKNKLVKDHFKNLTFTEKNGSWELDLNSFVPLVHFIETKTGETISKK